MLRTHVSEETLNWARMASPAVLLETEFGALVRIGSRYGKTPQSCFDRTVSWCWFFKGGVKPAENWGRQLAAPLHAWRLPPLTSRDRNLLASLAISSPHAQHFARILDSTLCPGG